MAEKGEAFLKGGCGCFATFVVVGLLCVLVGGSMHLDIGGALCLFVSGGMIGLIVLAIYNKGFREGRGTGDASDDEWNWPSNNP